MRFEIPSVSEDRPIDRDRKGLALGRNTATWPLNTELITISVAN
jgi:hypothetical protein